MLKGLRRYYWLVSTEQDADSLVPSPPAVAEPTHRRGYGRWPITVLVVILLVALVAGVIGLFVYDKATQIDRSEPTVTVQQILTAIFVEKETDRVGLFTCASLSGQTAIDTAERLVDDDATVSWDEVRVVSSVGGLATVRVRMMSTYPGELAPSGQDRWEFVLQEKDGWRVCSFSRTS